MDGDRYILGVKGHPETFTEVSEEEFIRAESGAGFRSKFGPGRVATGGFSRQRPGQCGGGRVRLR